MKNVKKIFGALSLLLITILLLSMPVLAAPANPDSIALHTVKVFENIFEADDMLFLISYDIAYASEPTEPAEDTFQMSIYSVNATSLIQSRALNDYQYNIQSIYFDATAAVSLTWGSNYVVRVMGNPAFFSPIEDVTMDTITLSSFGWVDGTAAESRELLRIHCLALAEDLENSDDWTVLIVSTPNGDALDSTGRTVFLAAVPSLDSVVPNLFQLASTVADVTKQTETVVLEEELTVETQLGTTVKAAFDGIGTFFGVSGNAVAMMWSLMFILVVASIVFLNSNNPTAALVLAIPIAILAVAAGALPMAALFSAAVILIVYMGYHIWLRGM